MRVHATNAPPLTADFAARLAARKQDVVANGSGPQSQVRQYGAAVIEPATPWPGWPAALASSEMVIETFVVAADDEVTATNDNEPFVSAWLPLASWLAAEVRSGLDAHGVSIEGDAFVTASLTHTSLLEGTAHMDDDTFMPDENVSVVAIVGELVGPRVATSPVAQPGLRPMGQIVIEDDILQRFEANQLPHCQAPADQIVVFPQFGQLHAGPAATDVASLAEFRQLLVFRAKAVTS